MRPAISYLLVDVWDICVPRASTCLRIFFKKKSTWLEEKEMIDRRREISVETLFRISQMPRHPDYISSAPQRRLIHRTISDQM